MKPSEAVFMPAPLRRKLLAINIALVAGLSIVGASLAWGIRSLRNDVTSAASEYAELRLIEEAMVHTSLAKTSLDDDSRDVLRAGEQVGIALQRLQSFAQFQETEEAAGPEHQEKEMREEKRATTALEQLRSLVEGMAVRGGEPNDTEAELLADEALMALSRMALETDVADARSSAAEITVTTLMIVGGLASLLVAGSVAANIVYYRSVMLPLRRVHSGVRRISAGQLSERLPPERTREFAELTADFNRMAEELQALYRDLEDKVQQKSRELVKSERLASVGFLAAGVAHEINNPLGIMSGYAELAQRWVSDPRPENLAEVRSALEIIRTEAFRCKGITERLLSLARMGDAARKDVAIPALATEVADMLRGLRKCQDRKLVLRFPGSAALKVKGNADELRQVILNLLVNALDAVPAGTGEVVMSGSRHNGSVQLEVKDNGIGMTADVLERVFEPFFSVRPSGGDRGTGLGLAISRSIIESHGGTLQAQSDGPGRGSRFVVELPLIAEVQQDGP